MAIRRASGVRQAPLGWVVVANASRARIFERDDDNGALREVSDHVHPESRMKGIALDGDRPGRAMKGAASTAFAPPSAPHEHELARFADELARCIERATHDGALPGLVLLASNPFLGALKARLGPGALRCLTAAIAVDLTRHRGAELERRVTQALRGGAAPAAEVP